MEVDVILNYKLGRIVRTVGFELKIINSYLHFQDAIRQAKERRHLFNYFYIVTEFNLNYFANILLHLIEDIRKLKDTKLGWIISFSNPESAFILQGSNFLKMDIQSFLDFTV